MEKIKRTLSDFIYSDTYIYVLSFLSLLAWVIEHFTSFPCYYIFLSIEVIFSLIVLFVGEDVYPYIPLLLNGFYCIDSPKVSFNDYPIYLFISAGILLFSIIFTCIKNKIDVLSGKLLIPNIIIAIVYAFTSYFNIGKQESIIYYFFPLVLFIYLPIYILFSTKSKNDYSKKIATLFVLGGLITLIETLLIYLSSDNVLELIKIKSPLLYSGWIYSNLAGVFLCFSLGYSFYLLVESTNKKDIIKNLVFTALIYLGIFLTLSRGIILVSLLSLIPYLILLFKRINQDHERFVLYSLLSILGVGIIFFAINYRFIIAFIDRTITLIKEGNIASGRGEIYQSALTKFSSSFTTIIFGNGFIASLIDSSEAGFVLYHQLILQVLVSAGLIGLVVIIYFIIKTYKQFLIGKTNYGLFTFIALISLLVISMFDNCFLTPIFMICLYISIAGLRNEQK